MSSFALVATATIVGLVGDALLQMFKNMGLGGTSAWGLEPYFKQHGVFESMFIGAGMMSLFYIVYIMLGLPVKIAYLALYGIVLDLLFRMIRIFPSLNNYYASLGYLASGVWGAIPMVLPLLLVSYKTGKLGWSLVK